MTGQAIAGDTDIGRMAMSDAAALVKRLRSQAYWGDIMGEAADMIEEQARLIEALKDIEDDLTVAYMAGLSQGRDEARAALNGERG
jgi:hypothetical protein